MGAPLVAVPLMTSFYDVRFAVAVFVLPNLITNLLQMFIYLHALKHRLFLFVLCCAAGIGANQLIVNEWAIAAGGHTRAGLEDNVRLNKHTLAPSNAALIQRAAEICEKYERPVATWRQTREMLNLQIEI